VHPGVALLLATRLQPGDSGRQATMRQILDSWVDATNGITKTPKVTVWRLSYCQWPWCH
jgi:hypothetical protein